MENSNYIYEAIYLLNKIYENNIPSELDEYKFTNKSIHINVYRAIIRVLYTNNLLTRINEKLTITDEQKISLENAMKKIMNSNFSNYEKMYDKATSSSQFFFDNISELEYEIYSRQNFLVTYKIGEDIIKHTDFTNKAVLELGGNSGGLATKIVSSYKNCDYSIIDTKIPCTIGNEFNVMNNTNINFIEGDIFNLTLEEKKYDFIILMNLLHDFDDEASLKVLYECTKFCNKNTSFLIIEDILIDEYKPKEIIMHGLRLAVECRGGKQRTLNDYEQLFTKFNFSINKSLKISDFHTLLYATNAIHS